MTARHGRLAWALVLLVGGAAGFLLGYGRSSAPPAFASLTPLIEQVAKEAGVDPHLLRAMVAAESSGDPQARSHAGAVGLLQLMEDTAREQAGRLGWSRFEPAMLLEPEANLRLGAGYLAWLLDRFDGDEVFAVAAYNAGLTKVRRWARRALDASSAEVIAREGYAETRTHVQKVMRWRLRFAAGS